MRHRWCVQPRLRLVALMLLGACATTVLCHAGWRVSVVFTHLFYVPIVCSALWWPRRGLLAALLLAMMLLASRGLFADADGLAADALRSLLFLGVSLLVATLGERLAAARQDLRRLAAELSIAEERQRRRIASDLHDGVCQTLIAAKFKLGSPSYGRTRAADRELEALLDEAIQDMRGLSLDLCPPMLYELGLTPSLQWLAQRVEETHGLTVVFEQQGVARPLDDDMRVLLFRGAQELLQNVGKHARASRARLTVRWEASRVALAVADDGVGLALDGGSRPSATGGFGLFSLRERLGHAGGSLVVRRRRPGAEVRMLVPTTTGPAARRRSA